MTPLETRVTKLEDMLTKHERMVEGLQQKLTALEADVQSNTRVTNAVKTDTEEIVNLMKGFKVVGVLAKASAAIAAMWVLLKGGKPW